MNSYVFILGRQPEIGLAELRALFGKVELVLPNIATIKSNNQPDIKRLGGTRKIGKIIYSGVEGQNDFLVEHLKSLPEGKITLGVSHYGRGASVSSARKTGLYLKKNVGRSMRVLPNATAEITDAATLGNKLGKSPNKVELMIIHAKDQLIVAELTGVQDLNSYTFRDRSRPRRDARVGMLPPKLAQIMINLAASQYTATAGKTLLDPFCGTGVVLQEAALMGFDVYGSDLEPRMIDYTKINLDWLKQKYRLSTTPCLEVGDATSHVWQQPFDLVVCETYLGQTYTTAPRPDTLRENMATCNLIIEKFLKNLHEQIDRNTGICVAIPVWFVAGKKHHLPVVQKLTILGFETKINSLVYARESQIVGRELIVLAKK
ncbi:methyltransferase domain-containing protein [Candidatus Saccharibacteria bacterium]|nr:methyltransferase domain-containing protein [Candidatus Saccharibacteria bacterium]